METTITIKNLDEFSIEWINQKAKLQGVNFEDIIVQLIHDQIRAGEKKTELVQYNDLDPLAGTWNRKEADEFLKSIDKFDQVDEKLWQ
ncbi:hypothetical protein [Desulfamplus magnetovallimortis]|nr:hypothetical protein [Desulfamplus magnetovallimortis]